MPTVLATVGATELQTVLGAAYDPNTQDPPRLPISRIAVATGNNYNALVGQSNLTGTIQNLTINDTLAIHAGQRQVRIDYRDSESSGAIKGIGVFVQRPGQTERLLLHRADNNTLYTRTGSEAVAFSIGYTVSGTTITSISISEVDPSAASNSDVIAGTRNDQFVSPGGLAHYVGQRLFVTAAATATERDLNNYKTPGNFTLNPPTGQSWQNGPSGNAYTNYDATGALYLEVRNLGTSRYYQKLVAKHSSATSTGIYERSTDTSGSWQAWIQLGSVAFASSADITTGTNTTQAITPAGLAGSTRGAQLLKYGSRPTNAQGNDGDWAVWP